MNCLAQRKRFKNKHPVWTDEGRAETEDDSKAEEQAEPREAADVEPKVSASEYDSDSEDDGALDMYAGDVRSSKLKLDSKSLQYKHLVDLNNQRSYNGPVQQVRFHPKSKIAFAGLRRSQVDLFEVDGERNRYIQNIKLPRTNKPFCSFSHDGNSIVIASETYKGSFYTYDMVTTSIQKYTLKSGYDLINMTDFVINPEYIACREQGSQNVMFLSAKTYENSFSVKINEPVRQILFTSNDDVFIAGENSQVYIWDMRKTNLCKHKFTDEGTVHITSVSVTEPSQLISIGSDSGVVNTYELGTCLIDKHPSPIKTFLNLKTSIDVLKYNSTGELLLMGSSKEHGAFRMIHAHSGSVYRNFPQPEKRYGNLLDAEFSPLSGYLALGCTTGRAHLCRISYYKSY